MAITKKNQDQQNNSGQTSGASQHGSVSSRSSRSTFGRSSQSEVDSDRTGSDMQGQYGEHNQNQPSNEFDRFSNEGISGLNEDIDYGSSSREENIGSQGRRNWMGSRQGQSNSERYGNESGSYGNQMSYGGRTQSGYGSEGNNYGSQARNRGNWGENYGGQGNYNRGMGERSQRENRGYGYGPTQVSGLRSQNEDYGSESGYGSSQYGDDNYVSSKRGTWRNEGGDYGSQRDYSNRQGNYDRSQGGYGSQGNREGQFGNRRGMRDDSYGNQSQSDYGSQRGRGSSSYDNMHNQDIYSSRGGLDYSQRGYGSQKRGDYDQREDQGVPYNQGGMNRNDTDNFGATRRGGWGNQGGDYGSQRNFGSSQGVHDRSQAGYGSQGRRNEQFTPQSGGRNDSYENRLRSDYPLQRGRWGYGQESRDQGGYNDDEYGQSFSRED